MMTAAELICAIENTCYDEGYDPEDVPVAGVRIRDEVSDELSVLLEYDCLVIEC